MIHAIHVRNVNQAFVEGLWWLKVNGIEEDSRNGRVLVCPDPVVTQYLHPEQRVLFDPVRNCNPFFHLFESVWMLAGSRYANPLVRFNARMADFAELDDTIRGAYGHRWLHHFAVNQLQRIIGELRSNPGSRQAVLAMWDPIADLGARVRDKPCNTHCYFRVLNGMLNMTVCCRSNDVIWGAYGANVVHFSILQQFIADALRIPMGTMTQFSNNFHIYKGVPRYEQMMTCPRLESDPYLTKVQALPHIVEPDEDPWLFLAECRMVVAGAHTQVTNRWLRNLVIPMIYLWEGRRHGVFTALEAMPECDWKLAFIEWLERREAAKHG